MTHSNGRALDRAARRYQEDHPGTSLSDARRAAQRRPDPVAEVTRLISDLRGPANRPTLMPLGGWGGQEGDLCVDLDAVVFDRPLRVTRDLLKRAGSFGLRVREVCGAVNLDRAAAEELLGQLARAGLLTAPEVDEQDEDEGSESVYRDHRTWRVTASGQTLARASGRRPSTRAGADALVRKIARAAAVVNQDPMMLWWVKEIRAVGAYADPAAERMLHVDLAVDLRPRLDDPHEQHKAEQRQRDEAMDQGHNGLERDFVGYGHWTTRLALAGHSRTVRLFRLEPQVPGPPVFSEERDLTISALTTEPYRPPADPAPLTSCSWCRRRTAATRVSRRGTSAARSAIGLCDTCLVLAGCTPAAGFFFSPRWTIRDTLTTLQAEAFHPTGCALCGRDAAGTRWWSEDHYQSGAVDLPLCDLCGGLLGLGDRPGRPGWWLLRYQDACMAGLHARLDTTAPTPEAKRPTRRRPPRLTDVHQQILAAVRRYGTLSPVDLHRLHDDQDTIYRRSDWWTVRLGHLLQHELLVHLAQDRDEGDYDNRVRVLEEPERDLRRAMRALHIPGPVWSGTAVVEPEPPEEWTRLAARLEDLAARHDRQALQIRALAPSIDPPAHL